MDSVPPTSRRVPARRVALGLIATGLLLVAVAAAYLAYSWAAIRTLDELVVTGEPQRAPIPRGGPANLERLEVELVGEEKELAPDPPERGGTPDPSSVRPYPGMLLDFYAWDEPWAAQPPADQHEDLVADFDPVGPEGLDRVGSLPRASRIVIPNIDLDAKVRELAIRDLGDSRAYETPNRIVGHIPDTANPGESNNGWFFGHLESPLRDQGSVFRDLPRIPEKLKKGERVFVIVETGDGSYLYEVYATDTLHEDDLRITGSQEANITLVACVPTLVYDHRLLVTAQLVGFKSPA